MISSDAGQLHNPPPVEALRIFIEILLEGGLPPNAVRRMVQTNPADLLYG